MLTLSMVIMTCLALAVALFLMQCWFEQRYGDLAARWVLPKELVQVGAVVLFVGVSIGLGMKVFASLNRNVVMVLGFAVGLSALWAAWWIVQDARKHAGEVLVDVGRVEPKGRYAVVAFIVLGVWALGLSVSGRDLFMLLNAALFASSAALSHFISEMNMLFTDKGLYTPNGEILWAQVDNYKWTGGTGTTHTLLLTLKRRFFKTMVIPIPWDAMDQVSNVLEEFVGQAILHEVEAIAETETKSTQADTGDIRTSNDESML